ncbi:MAG: hypothetical protein DPW11_04440 [bacterium]|nr:hypothetical protein [bacterium]RIK51144.1 MAG: hypothetical protein DCC61_03670 [Candidatus Microgenomates bacterium]
MPQISRLVAGKKNPGRVNLYLDGKYAFALSLDEVVKNGLKKGKELTDEQVQVLKKTDDLNWAYAKILNFLSFRPRTEFEVRNRLKKYALIEAASTDWIINKLTDQGYLSDLSFAQWFVESRIHNRPRSKRHLISELRAHGVDMSIINQVLKEIDETRSLEQLITKKRTLSRDKLLQFLLRRGFKYDLVQAKLNKSRYILES